MLMRSKQLGLRTCLALAIVSIWGDSMIHRSLGRTPAHRHQAVQDDTQPFKTSRDILQAYLPSSTAPLSLNTNPATFSPGYSSPRRAPRTAGAPAPKDNPIGPSDAGKLSANSQPRHGEAPPPQPQQPPPAPRNASRVDIGFSTLPSVQLFPADVAVVHTPSELQAAISNGRRDIEIRSHLDLRSLPLKQNPIDAIRSQSNIRLAGTFSALAYLTWPTRSIRGNCTAGLHTGAESAAARLKRLYRELSGSRVPLKPFQCLILTNSNTLFLSHGNGFWLDNLYVGVMQPRRQYDKALAEVVSTGESATNTSIGLKPMNIFLTNITMHGHGLEEYSTRLVSLERYNSWTSLLFQDSIFVDLVGRDRPFLVADGAYATFSNCLFRNVHLPRNGLFDVSQAGAVTLLNCHFSNVSTANGLVDVVYSDYMSGYSYQSFSDIYGDYGPDGHDAYEIALSPAPEADTHAYGSEYVVVNETMTNCLYQLLSGYQLPGCSEQPVAAGAQPDSVAYDTFRQDYLQWREERETKRGNAFYDQYYDDSYYDVYHEVYQDHQPAMALAGSEHAPPSGGDYSQPLGVTTARAPVSDYGLLDVWTSAYDVPRVGMQLSTEHPWFQAIVEELPERPAVPPGEAAAYMNGLPLCTNCSAAAAVSPPAPRAANGTLETIPQASSRNAPHAVLIYVPLACSLSLLALAVGVVVYWRRRRPPGDAARKDPHMSGRNATGSRGGAATAAGLGPTAGLHAINMHPSLTEDLKSTVRSKVGNSQDIAVVVAAQQRLAHEQIGPAMNLRYEYKLPRGLGLAMKGSTEGTESASEIVLHTDGNSAGGSGSEDTLRPPSEIFFALQHQNLGLEVPACSGRGQCDSCFVSSSSHSYMRMPSQSTQAPRIDAGTLGAHSTAISHGTMRGIVRQLNRFSRQDLLLGRFELLGPHHRRQGGQAVVQFAVDPRDGRDFAVKFFLQQEAFLVEAAIYAACFPSLRTHLSPTRMSCLANQAVQPPPSHQKHTPPRRTDSNRDTTSTELGVPHCMGADDGGDHAGADSERQHYRSVTKKRDQLEGDAAPGAGQRHEHHQVSGGTQATGSDAAVVYPLHSGENTWLHTDALRHMPDVAAQFLPQVEAVCADAVDPRGRPLPPCIIMEKGESLQDWSNRAEPDRFASLAVLSNVASRLAVMHEAGYVHRDLKPANVMWLPRENRWTVIDFGCVAAIGDVVPLSFTLAYASPEVVKAHEAGAACLEATSAIDSWSLGVMAFELLTGAPAFKFLTEGRAKVVARLKGDLPLPWEEELSPLVVRQLGVYKEPVMHLLQRHPSDRISMDRFDALCSKAFSGQSAHAAVSAEIKHIAA